MSFESKGTVQVHPKIRTLGPGRRRWLGLAALSMLLTGCDPSQQAGSKASVPSQATAPEVTSAAPAPALPVPIEPAGKKRMRELLPQVEAAYKRGEMNYRRGKLAESKVEFDRAVDLMLASGIDIKSDAQMEAEFIKVIDGINALEMEALKVGNGFVAPVEPTPADVAAEEVTFNIDPSILANAQKNLQTTKSDLPLVVNDYVAAFINFFANTKKGHYTLLHSFQRSGRYKAMIKRVMAEEGVPQDLIYLAVAESGFQPRALNPGSHAGGMWQFMPYGNYGLARTQYVDERFDPEKSTRAYARYMKFLYAQLGDWYLAMAGYNWGAGNVQRAVMKTGYSDFWELYRRNNLPGETKNYVPEILAAIIIANNPQQYGFDDITLDPPVLTDTVTVNSSIHLRLVADLVGAPVDEMQALNPSLLRGVTPPDVPFDLHLPAGTAEQFNRRIAAIPESRRNAWRYHRLGEGETLASVARDFHVSVETLAEANQLEESASLQGRDGLAIPAAPAAIPAVKAGAMTYSARKGDTLVTIADRFGVSLAQLRAWNKITGNKVQPGQKLRVSAPSAQPSSAKRTQSSSSAKPAGQGKSAGSKSTRGTGSVNSAPNAAKSNRGAAPSKAAPGEKTSLVSKSATAKEKKTSAGKTPSRPAKTQNSKQK